MTVIVDVAEGVVGLGLKATVTRVVDGPITVADRVTALPVPEVRVALTVAVVVVGAPARMTAPLVGLTERL